MLAYDAVFTREGRFPAVKLLSPRKSKAPCHAVRGRVDIEGKQRCAIVRRCKAVMCAAVLAIACASCLGVLPTPAYAYLDQVTDSYPASQEVTVGGDVLTADVIPEGTYPISVSSSSFMCKLTNVTLTSVQGQLWATFTISKAYNALYLGTAEEAASLSGTQGVDYTPYYTTDPLEGYVARQFSLPIPALNTPITLATYSGGNNGTERGLWYTRTVAFNSSSQVMQAIEDAKNPSPAEDGGSSSSSAPAEQPKSEGDDTKSSGAASDSSSTVQGPHNQEPSTGDDTKANSNDDGNSAGTDSMQEEAGTVEHSDDDETNTGNGDESDDGEESGDEGESSDGEEPGDGDEANGENGESGANNGANAGVGVPGANGDGSSQDGEGAGAGTATAAAAPAVATPEQPSSEASKSAASASKSVKAGAKAAIPISIVGANQVELPEIKSVQELDVEEIERNNAGKLAAAGAIGVVDLGLMGAFLIALRHARPRKFPGI